MADLDVLDNDQSVLENYHCSLTFQILQKAENDIAKNLSREEFTLFRKIVISTILDTDLSKHFMIVQLFEKKTENDDPASPDSIFNMEKEQNRLMAMGVALKCAGNPQWSNFRYRAQCQMP